MWNSRKITTAIYLAAFVIFVGAFLTDVHMTPFFPYFVVICMLLGLTSIFVMWRAHRDQGHQ